MEEAFILGITPWATGRDLEARTPEQTMGPPPSPRVARPAAPLMGDRYGRHRKRPSNVAEAVHQPGAECELTCPTLPAANVNEPSGVTGRPDLRPVALGRVRSQERQLKGETLFCGRSPCALASS